MSKHLRSYVYLAVALVAVYLLSFAVGELSSYDQRNIINIGVYMILATSLNLINGFTGQFSLGHAGFMSIGAYMASWVTTIGFADVAAGMEGGMGQEFFFLAALIGGGLAAGVAGLLVGIPSLRLKGDYLAIVTLGFGEIIRVILQNIPSLGGSLGMSGIPRYTNFMWTFGVLAVLVFIVQNMMNSTYGKGFLAVRDDEIAAESVGVDTTRYKVTAFVIGAFFAGVAGGIFGHYNGLIRPEDFNFLKSVEIVVMVILGGMGSTWGVLFAAGLLAYLPEGLRDFSIGPVKFRDFRMSIYALSLILLMILRPQGLFGDFNLSKYIKRFTRKQESEPTIEA